MVAVMQTMPLLSLHSRADRGGVTGGSGEVTGRGDPGHIDGGVLDCLRCCQPFCATVRSCHGSSAPGWAQQSLQWVARPCCVAQTQPAQHYSARHSTSGVYKPPGHRDAKPANLTAK